MPTPLVYSTCEDAIATVTLSVSEEHATLRWPPMPRWMGWTGVAATALGAVGNAFFLVRITSIILNPQTPQWAHPWIEIGFISGLAFIGLGLYLAIHLALWIYRFGKVPKLELSFGHGEYSIAKPGWWRIRCRRYSLQTLATLEVKPVADIFGRHRSFALMLHPKKGFCRRYPFSTNRPELPARIEAALLHHLQNPQQTAVIAQKDVS